MKNRSLLKGFYQNIVLSHIFKYINRTLISTLLLVTIDTIVKEIKRSKEIEIYNHI